MAAAPQLMAMPNCSGINRRPAPIAGRSTEVCADTVIVAVSQAPDRDALDPIARAKMAAYDRGWHAGQKHLGCFFCEQCFMYCNGAAFTRVEKTNPGNYFVMALDACEGCGKCIELCPCGYLDTRGDQPIP